MNTKICRDEARQLHSDSGRGFGSSALQGGISFGGKMKNLDSLMAAYLAVWAIFFVYHFTVARRVARLQDEIASLKQSLKQ